MVTHSSSSSSPAASCGSTERLSWASARNTATYLRLGLIFACLAFFLLICDGFIVLPILGFTSTAWRVLFGIITICTACADTVPIAEFRLLRNFAPLLIFGRPRTIIITHVVTVFQRLSKGFDGCKMLLGLLVVFPPSIRSI
jgi:hypothetical protein